MHRMWDVINDSGNYRFSPEMTRLLVLQQKKTWKGCGGCLVHGTSSWFQSRCLTSSCWAGNSPFQADKVVSAERCFSRRGEASHTLLQKKPLWGSQWHSSADVPNLRGLQCPTWVPILSEAVVQWVTGLLGPEMELYQVWVQQGGCPTSRGWSMAAHRDDLSVTTGKWQQQRKKLVCSILGGQESKFAAWRNDSTCFQSLHINVLLCTRLKFHFCRDSTVQCTSGQICIRARGLFTECTYGIIFQILFCCSLKHWKSWWEAGRVLLVLQ